MTNKYEATLAVKFDFITATDLDGAKLANTVKDFIKAGFIPEIKKFGAPGLLFDTVLTIAEVEPDDLPGMDERTFNLAMAEYLELTLNGRSCGCPTCRKVGAITSVLGDSGIKEFINWLRTGEAMTDHDPKKLMQILMAIGMMGTLSSAYSENMPQPPGVGPRFNPAAHMN